MNCFKLMLLVLALGAFISTAYSQDDIYLLNHSDIGKHQRPLVEFNHKLHAENKLDCIRCHHDFDAYLNNRGTEGQTCDSCHKKEIDDDLLSLEDAFHLQCKGCHEAMKTGPVTCGECHVRK